ncbi:hypothetical protein BRO06_10895 [Xanthomonas oryzae pv. oryzae]|nr:hypothetical protein BRO06_10895 [Xanthomonas oryzae pv. oryzae]
MPRWPSDWLGLSPEASHTARVAGSHRTNGFGFSNTVEITQLQHRMLWDRVAAVCRQGCASSHAVGSQTSRLAQSRTHTHAQESPWQTQTSCRKNSGKRSNPIAP